MAAAASHTAGVRFCYQADRPKGEDHSPGMGSQPGPVAARRAGCHLSGVSSAYTASGKEGYTALAPP